MGRRIDNYPIATQVTGGDYVLIDSQQLGTRKILATDLGGGGGQITGITIDVIGKAYDVNTIYQKGDSATYNNKLWEANKVTTVGTFNQPDWDEIDVVTYLIDEDDKIWLVVNEHSADIQGHTSQIHDIWFSIAPQFSASATYKSPDLVLQGDMLYKCTSATNVSGAWSSISSNFTVTTIAAELKDIRSSLSTISGDITSLDHRVDSAETRLYDLEQYEQVYVKAYSSSSTYNTGDFVVYNSKLFECLDDNVTGAWDHTKWSLTDVPSALSKINKRGSGAHTYQGTSTPSASLGEDGDIYMQYDSNGITDVYGKINGGWVLFPSNGGGGGGHVIQPLSITERTVSTSTFSVTEVPQS